MFGYTWRSCWVSVAMTMGYVHPTPEHKMEALRKLERFQGYPQKYPHPRNGENLIHGTD